MIFFPLKKEKLFIQIFIFLTIWIALQVGFVALFQNYLSSQFGSPDMRELLKTHSDDNAFRQTIIWGNGIQQLVTFALPVIIFGVWSSSRPMSYIGFTNAHSRPYNILFIVMIAATMVFTLPSMAALIRLIPLGDWSDKLQDMRHLMESFYFADKSMLALLRNLLLMAFIPALCEELFFRGVIQRFIYSSTQRLWLSLILTGLFFSLLHSSAVNFVPIVMAAIILGLIYHYTKNLWWSILAHFIYNGTQIIVNYFKPISNENTSATELSSTDIMSVTAMLVIGGGIIYVLLKKMHSIYLNKVAPIDQTGTWSFEEK